MDPHEDYETEDERTRRQDEEAHTEHQLELHDRAEEAKQRAEEEWDEAAVHQHNEDLNGREDDA